MDKLKIEPTTFTPEVTFDVEKRVFEISGESRPQDSREFYGPIITWLNELVYLFDIEGLLFKTYDILSVHDHRLEALAHGEIYVEGRHPIKTTVKAATYHQLKIEHLHGVWTTQVIFDL